MYIIIRKIDDQCKFSRNQGTQNLCSGTTQRDGVGREVGGRFRMGGHVHPWLIHVDVWQNTILHCIVLYVWHHNIVISRQLK